MCQSTIPTLLSPELIVRALFFSPFNTAAAHARMSPQPRTIVRPPHLPGEPNTGAVLIILFSVEQTTQVIMIRRQEHLQYHPGQISFPGGRREVGETLHETAIREAREEVGVNASSLTLLGMLTPIYVPPSDFMVHPFVAWHNGQPEVHADASEVAEILMVPVARLDAPSSRGREVRIINGNEVMIPYFIVHHHKIWGATAIILSELLERIRAARTVAPSSP